MKDVFIKLRVKCYICHLRLKILVDKITKPFQVVFACIQRYWVLRRIDKESQTRWERHIKIKELEGKDELSLKIEQFHLLRTQLIGAFFRCIICAGSFVILQEQPNDVDNSRKEFQKNKEELVSLLEKLCDHYEIAFDEKINSEILAWEFGMFETQEELNKWVIMFSEYICTLEII